MLVLVRVLSCCTRVAAVDAKIHGTQVSVPTAAIPTVSVTTANTVTNIAKDAIYFYH